MKILCFLAGLALTQGAFYGKSSGVKTLGDKAFPDKKSKNTWFVEFYAPWCGHCKQLKPKWVALGKKLIGSNVKVGAVDCTQNEQICAKHGVQGYPTLKLFKKGKPMDYSGPRELDGMIGFLKYSAGLKLAKGKEGSSSGKKGKSSGKCKAGGLYTPKSGVDSFCSKNFPPTSDTENGYFVEFYAPWCGHCKALKPKWKKLAKAVAKKDNLKVGAVDCTIDQAICQRYGVQGYPTIKFFRNGKAVDYKGAREVQPMLQFGEREMRKKKKGKKKAPKKKAPKKDDFDSAKYDEL